MNNKYKRQIFNGVKSHNFLDSDWQIITLERLFKQLTNHSLYESVWKIHSTEERIKYIVYQIERITGIQSFGIYMAKLLTLDAFFLNEDRHMHNIAILMNSSGNYKLCPVFDNGACLLSDTTMDYPLGNDIFELIPTVKAKTVSLSFDEQLDCVEALYGRTLTFSFTKKDVDTVLQSAVIYSREETERVKDIIFSQISKYKYLFKQ